MGAWHGALGFILLPFRVSKPQDPTWASARWRGCQGRSQGQRGRRAASEASLSFSFAPAKLHAVSALDTNGGTQIRDCSQLQPPPLLSLRLPLLLSIWTKLQVLPNISMLAGPLHAGLFLPFSPWEIQSKSAVAPTVTPSLDTVTLSSRRPRFPAMP